MPSQHIDSDTRYRHLIKINFANLDADKKIGFSDVTGNPLFQLQKTGMIGVRIGVGENGETFFTINHDSVLRRSSQG